MLAIHARVVRVISMNFLNGTMMKLTKDPLGNETLTSVMSMVASSIDTEYTIALKEDSSPSDSKSTLEALDYAFNLATEWVMKWIITAVPPMDKRCPFVHSDQLQVFQILTI